MGNLSREGVEAKFAGLCRGIWEEMVSDGSIDASSFEVFVAQISKNPSDIRRMLETAQDAMIHDDDGTVSDGTSGEGRYEYSEAAIMSHYHATRDDAQHASESEKEDEDEGADDNVYNRHLDAVDESVRHIGATFDGHFDAVNASVRRYNNSYGLTGNLGDSMQPTPAQAQRIPRSIWNGSQASENLQTSLSWRRESNMWPEIEDWEPTDQ